MSSRPSGMLPMLPIAARRLEHAAGHPRSGPRFRVQGSTHIGHKSSQIAVPRAQIMGGKSYKVFWGGPGFLGFGPEVWASMSEVRRRFWASSWPFSGSARNSVAENGIESFRRSVWFLSMAFEIKLCAHFSEMF